MGQRKSKTRKSSYDVPPTSMRNNTPPAAAVVNGNEHAVAPQKLLAPDMLQQSSPKPLAVVGEDVVDSKLVPAWVSEEQFVDILRQYVGGFVEITKFSVKPALAPGENYATLMLRVGIDVQLEDNSSQHVSYMLKVAHDTEQMKQMLEFMNVFEPENAIYFDVLPELEEMYKSVGKEIHFGAKGYKFTTNPSPHNVLLEDLGPRGFKNANRLQGLDMEHTKAVLKKLAEFHAVSACRVATKGAFAEVFMQPFEKYVAARPFMEGMMAGFKNQFLENLPSYKDGPLYYEILKTQFDKLIEEWLNNIKYNPDEFNVLNHGDCWTNNILFQYTDDGKIAETHFVDFQQPSFGSPARDLYYFVLSSVDIDIKLKHFDYFMRYYFDHLRDNLKLLAYPKRMPTLRELNTHLYKYASWPLSTVIVTLPVVLLDPTESAQFDNFVGDTEEARKFKNLIYTNDRYRAYIEQILPWLHNRGLLESNEKPVEEAVSAVVAAVAAVEQNSTIPEWVTEEYFIDVLKQNVKGFKQIRKFVAAPGTKAGENYSSIMIKADMDVELEDGSSQSVSYMLKVPPKGDAANAMLSAINIFKKEADMYNNYIPQFEQFYRDAGKDIVIGPKSFQFVKDPGCETVLLENLTPLGYSNADRLVGLDMEHTEAILCKLAEFHAASACYYATKGSYPKMYEEGMMSEDNREMMAQMIEVFFGVLIDNMKKYTGSEEYIDKLVAMKPHMIDIYINAYKVDESAFNVLNHGDLWTNNVMFQYGSDGKIKSTYFVDFAMCKYGSPAQDLFYFLLSSPNFDIKLEHFDYFVRFYHENLTKNLQLLNYPKEIPSLKQLHQDLFKNNSWAFATVSGVMTAILLDPTENASMENMMGSDAAGIDLKNLLYSNPRYRKQAEVILPWLNRRGLLEYDEIKAKVAETTTIKNTNPVPEWITEEYFIDILKQHISDFKQIKKFAVAPGTNVGDNYASLMLKVEIDVELTDGSSQSLSFMLKVQPIGEQAQAMLGDISTFKKEGEMYKNIIPQFEQFYKDAGSDVIFGPKSFEFVKDPGCETILLENLRPYGYKNADRLAGLDKEHTENVLRKLAEFHAASAYFLATNQEFSALFKKGVFNLDNRDMMIKMTESFYGLFYEIAKTYKGCEEYYDKITKSGPELIDTLIKASEVDGNVFLKVLNHGDLWTNNIMFQYDAEGKIQNTCLIDYQMCQYGSPAQDLYYFLMSSPKLDIKLEQFDYFVRIYYEHLTKNLELLKYPNEIPSLKDLHLELFRNGIWGFSTATGVMCAILLEPTENASMENMLSEDEVGINFKKLMYSNQRYRTHIEAILPWLNRRGLLDFDEINPKVEQTTTIIKNTSPVPDWITEEYFIDILKQNISDFKQIKKFAVAPGTNVGDNYASLMLKAEIEVELADGSSESVSYMLKVQPMGDNAQAMIGELSSFKKEGEMYKNILPQFEQFYKDAGVEVVFGPKSFEFVKDPGCQTILLENLRPYGYKNADRLAGLDKEHTENVLRKLAEFHAASAYFLSTDRIFPEYFSKGIFNSSNREIMNKFIENFFVIFADVAKTYKGNEEYYDKLTKSAPYYVDIIIKANEDIDSNKFLKVLNHGDVWTNNVMFRYDAEGKIQNTCLIDYQMCQYGSPAQDLYYFLISSPSFDIKLDQFDYFVRFYYEHLTKNLELLKYPNEIPSLKDLHLELFRNGIWGYSAASGVMSAILLDPTETASMENMFAEDEAAQNFKRLLYTNQRYRTHIEAILPWLNRRGLLDFEMEDLTTKTHKFSPPAWVDEAHLADILAENIAGYSKVLRINAAPATQAGDNYASTLLAVDVVVELKDGATKSVSYMLKIPNAADYSNQMTDMFHFFEKEITTYDQYLPEFEQMYKEAGTEVVFGPKYYKFQKETGSVNLLLENLRTRNFKVNDRLQGLDKQHTEAVLRKLAQFHAASVKRVQVKGAFPEIFNYGFYCEESRQMFEHLAKGNGEILDALPLYEGHAEYQDKIPHLLDIFVDCAIDCNKVDPAEFNVLNHGDTWNNNIMFQYDDAGNIQETYFVDFQVCKYGSPAQDLFYLLISSTHLDIKVEQFDYFINYYHQQLIENLTLLKYSGKVPTLKELHASLLKYGFTAFTTLFGVTTVCLLEPTEGAVMEAFVAETPEAAAFRSKLYTNDRFKAHAGVVLTWLNKRGLLDF